MAFSSVDRLLQILSGGIKFKKARWYVYHSYNKEEKRLITSLTEEGCINATRYYMKGLQEGFMEVITHQGSVDGKL